MTQYQNYYQWDCPEIKAWPSLEGEQETEIAIVGGGYAGLATALGLLERGKRSVALLEQEHIGYGASGRNGGFVFGGYALAPQQMVKKVGVKRARELYQLTLDAVELISRRCRSYAIDCELVEEGVIWANWFRSQSILRDEQVFMREVLGVDWEYWSPEETRRKINSDRYTGALFEPGGKHFQPFRYAQGVAQQISRMGGNIFERSQAVSVSETKDGMIEVVTPTGKLRAQHLVVCAGGYINRFFPQVARAVLPIATYVMVTEPITEQLSELLRTRAAIYDTRFAFDYYRPLNNGRLLWGGRIHALKQAPAHLEELLRQDMLRVFPTLQDVNIDFAWSGLMGYCRHQMPAIGRLNDRIWYNIGYGGHGVAPTTVGGEVIAAAIAEKDTRYQWFSPWGLDWAGGAAGLLAAQASYWWYQSRDRLKEWLGR